MEKVETLTFSEDEILYLLVISGVEDDETFARFQLQSVDTTKDRLLKGRESLLARDLIEFADKSEIPVMDDTLIGLVGTVTVGEIVNGNYVDIQTNWKSDFVKEAGWYVFKGEEVR